MPPGQHALPASSIATYPAHPSLSSNKSDFEEVLESDVQRLFALHKGLTGASHALAEFQTQVFPVQNSISQKILGGFIQHEELRPLGRLLFYRHQELWNFVENPLLPMTNNQAERDIRPPVIWRKSSQGSRSVRGDRFIERIQTLNQTCRKQNNNPFLFIKNALCAHWAGTKSPSLLPKPTLNHMNGYKPKPRTRRKPHSF